MFSILDMEKSLQPSQPNIKLNPKPVATSTVSKPPKDQNDKEKDFLDFVPIDNNANDFDLSTILQDIEKNN